MLLAITQECLFSANLNRIGKDFYFSFISWFKQNLSFIFDIVFYIYIYKYVFHSSVIISFYHMFRTLIPVSNQHMEHV